MFGIIGPLLGIIGYQWPSMATVDMGKFELEPEAALLIVELIKTAEFILYKYGTGLSIICLL